MATTTSMSFGFISYNSYEFLKDVLHQFVDDKIFSRCACWYHESIGKDKNHFHCWVEPFKRIDTMLIVDSFVEIDEEGNQQSIAIKHGYCKSKFNDAYLYGIHNSDYLESKGKKREVVNIVSDKHIYIGDFEEDIEEAMFYLEKKCLAPYQRLKRLVYDGLTLEQVFITLRTPFAQMNSVRRAYFFIKKEYDLELRNGLEIIGDNSVFVSLYQGQIK